MAALALLLVAAPVRGRAAPFDLAGPKLEMRVTRGGRTLPMAQVPSLAPGDQILIKPDLSSLQSAHYVLVAAFLRGATNPPPEEWFARTATWTAGGREGLRVTVPEGAQEALVFLAPEAGGDFKTVMNAVRGRPGAFVRATQQLNQASLDRSRLDAFTADVTRINQADPKALKTASPLLARSLGVKLDAACLQKVSEVQASCLTQDRDALVLDGSASGSKLESLATGYSADLVRDLSFANWAGSGSYSPYVASLLDIVHLLDASRTAQYQYIPALITEGDTVASLLLNAPPSFRNPKSVLVVGLPPIEPAVPPILHAVEPQAAYCAARPDLVLPIDGAPLFYSTSFGHDLVLRLTGRGGKTVDLPAHADAAQGGVVVEPARAGDLPPGPVEGALAGTWGFTPFGGPSFHFVVAQPQAWSARGADRPSLISGQASTLRLAGQATACIESVQLQLPSGVETPLDWTASAPDELTIHLPPKPAGAGDFKLLIKAAGLKAPDVVPLGLYARPAEIASVVLHAGDHGGIVTGAHLDEVRALTFEGVTLTPGDAPIAADGQLELAAADQDAMDRLRAGDAVSGQVVLNDGRKIPFQTTVGPPRPRASLMSKAIEPAAASAGLVIHLGDKEDVPRAAKLTFSIHAEGSTSFTGRESLEVATANGAFTTELTAADGLTLQDPQVAVASLDLEKRFTASAFGPLRFRIVKDGLASEWQPLATLVRLPEIRAVSCPGGRGTPCKIVGSNLFLIAAVAREPRFDKPIAAPDGFPGDALPAPHPAGGRLYLKLRDDPAAVDILVVGSREPRAARTDAEPETAAGS